jgi:hypothetical protein
LALWLADASVGPAQPIAWRAAAEFGGQPTPPKQNPSRTQQNPSQPQQKPSQTQQNPSRTQQNPNQVSLESLRQNPAISIHYRENLLFSIRFAAARRGGRPFDPARRSTYITNSEFRKAIA